MKRDSAVSFQGLQGKTTFLLGAVILLPFLSSGLTFLSLDHQLTFTLFFGTLGIILGVTLAVVFQRQVYGPLRDLSRRGARFAAQVANEGFFRTETAEAPCPDEIRELEKVIEELGDSVRKGTREVIRRVKVLSLLDRLDETLCETLDRYEVFRILAIEGVRVLDYDRLILMVWNGEQDRIEVEEFEPTTQSHPRILFVPLDDYFEGDRIRILSGPTLYPDRSSFEGIPELSVLAKREISSCVTFPLRSGPALLCFCHRLPGRFTEADLDLLEPLARKLSASLQMIRLFEDVRLTGRIFPG